MDWFDFAEERLAMWKARDRAARNYRKTFTPAALKALDMALAEARNRRLSAIGAEHLLLGLAQLREGRVPKILADLGLNAELLRSEPEKTQGHGPEKLVPERLFFTPRMKSILKAASHEAKVQGRDLIDAENLLIGLVREKEGVPAILFRRLGIDAEDFETRLLAESARI
jgi:ATP-dependent Clp protease ATP-binding subunit ClpC